VGLKFRTPSALLASVREPEQFSQLTGKECLKISLLLVRSLATCLLEKMAITVPIMSTSNTFLMNNPHWQVSLIFIANLTLAGPSLSVSKDLFDLFSGVPNRTDSRRLDRVFIIIKMLLNYKAKEMDTEFIAHYPSFLTQWPTILLSTSTFLLTHHQQRVLTRNSNLVHVPVQQVHQCVSKTPIPIITISRLCDFSLPTLGMLTLFITFLISRLHSAALTLFLATTDAVRNTEHRCVFVSSTAIDNCLHESSNNRQ
jgi:hypothetical protein